LRSISINIGQYRSISSKEKNMGTIVKDNGGADFEMPTTGVQRAICINYFDIGLQPGFNEGDSPKEQIVVLWELEETDSKGQHFTISRFYTKSIHEKSNLGKDLVSWRGKPFTDDERAGFDLDNLKGKPCQLNLVPTDKGKVKIDKVMKAQTVILGDGKPHIAEHWRPETTTLWVPPYVTKAKEKALIPKKAEPVPAQAKDDFQDDIPF
jgi:hypothetical protein